MKYVSGDASRIFINTTLGCDSNCSYCYLGSQGVSTGKKTAPPLSADSLIERLHNLTYFKKGKFGTILSIGCYSECWSPSNISTTIELIKQLIKFGNPIQFATKRVVHDWQLQEISTLQHWSGQLSVFVSCSSISQWRIYEKGTSRPIDRFGGLPKIKNLGVNIFIYMKPVIESVTITDILEYCKILDACDCPIVVGDEFHYLETESLQITPQASIPSVGLYIKDSKDSHKIIEILNQKGYIVFRNSINAVEFFRGDPDVK